MSHSTTPQSVLQEMTVNEVINVAPAAVEVFKRFGIDSCCGGARPIREAAELHGADPTALCTALFRVISNTRPEFGGRPRDLETPVG
jgi:iron-sulfur cluster repair protein YtfE (RIC family)